MSHRGPARDKLSSWAADRGIALGWAESLATGGPDISANPCIDHGRTLERVPAVTLAPADEDQLRAAFVWLREHEIPYVLRGTGHCSGGQSTISGGALVDLRQLAGVVEDDPAGEWVRVRGGTYWLELCEYLAPQGRRPVSLTTNASSTIGGTLAVGGFGDTTHRHGLQTASVLGLTLVTPDGARHAVGPGDDLFRYALAGRGQLGAITEVTLRTIRASYQLRVRRMEWKGMGQFVRDALIMTALPIFDFMRVRVFWREGNSVEGMCATFGDDPIEAEPGFNLLQPAEWTEIGEGDLLENLRVDARPSWRTYGCPAVEFVLPLPEGLDIWEQRLGDEVDRAGIVPYMQHGASLVLTPRQGLPLAPVPDRPYNLLIALRPIIPTADVGRFVEPMRRVAAAAIDEGARLYLMSVEPDRERIRRQFGAAWDPWLALKRRVDPLGLCNPGLLI